MIASPLFYPMLAHVCWAMLLYVLLTICRAPVVWGLGARQDGTNPWAAIERRISANLSNQFEWPLFFHVACLLAMRLGQTVETLQIGLAWVFVAGRLAHSLVQIATSNVRLRGIVFTVNFLAVVGMWVNLAMAAQQMGSG